MPKTCFLFTQNFPYGKGEAFIEQEIPFLSAKFKEVFIFPADSGKQEARALPSNVKVIDLFGRTTERFSAKRTLLGNIPVSVRLILSELLAHPSKTIKGWRNVANDLLHQVYKARQLDVYCKAASLEQVVLYSFWFDRWATVLGILKRKRRDVSFFSRAHSFDLYEEENKGGYILGRKFQLQNVSRAYSVSKHGAEYMKRRYPQFSDKIAYAYLGTAYHNERSPFKNNGTDFIIVSCGSVQKRKRTVVFPEVMLHLPANYKWIHFGDGPDMNMLKELIADKGLSDRVVLYGHVENEKFLSYLQNSQVSVFLSLSSNEGVPYTMIEAISYGIPLMSTDVGGCAEICNENTGVLIRKNADPESIAEEVLKFNGSEKNTLTFRNSVRKYWEDHFNAENNYTAFYEEISA